MNSVSSITANASEAEFMARRNEWLNDFSRFEGAVCACLRRFTPNFDTSSKPFVQRLKDLSQAQPGAQLSAKAAKTLANLPTEFKRELQIRTSIVHGTMEVGQRGDEPAALFHNAMDQAQELPNYLVMTKADFDVSQKRLKAATSRLRSYLSRSPVAD